MVRWCQRSAFPSAGTSRGGVAGHPSKVTKPHQRRTTTCHVSDHPALRFLTNPPSAIPIGRSRNCDALVHPSLRGRGIALSQTFANSFTHVLKPAATAVVTFHSLTRTTISPPTQRVRRPFPGRCCIHGWKC